MADEIDYAHKVMDQELEAALKAACGNTQEFTIVYVTQGTIESANFTGTGGGCVRHMEEMLGIDLINGRWARGHDVKSIKASDGEMEHTLQIHFQSR